jgi:hypothetical protein
LDFLEDFAGGRVVSIQAFDPLPHLFGFLAIAVVTKGAGALEGLTDRIPAVLVVGQILKLGQFFFGAVHPFLLAVDSLERTDKILPDGAGGERVALAV